VAPPKRKAGSRVTPKGTKPGAPQTGVPSAGAPPSRARASGAAHASQASSRYTPPIPKAAKVSPPWVPVLMFVLLGLGVVVILLNYLELLPGSVSNWYLFGGLGLILGGILVATQYR
jgi:hypothetical protein